MSRDSRTHTCGIDRARSQYLVKNLSVDLLAVAHFTLSKSCFRKFQLIPVGRSLNRHLQQPIAVNQYSGRRLDI